MVDFIRTLCMLVTGALLSLVPTLCGIFYDLSVQPRLFLPETIQTLSRNIYSLVSVVMLFALAAKSISAIVSPELLDDGKKGLAGVAKRSVIALVLIVIIPFGFDFAYKLQSQIMGNAVIEKMILGMNYNGKGNSITTVIKDLTDTAKERSKAGEELGQTLGTNILSAVLYPSSDDGECKASGNLNLARIKNLRPDKIIWDNVKSLSICGLYEYTINTDIRAAKYLTWSINAERGVTFSESITSIIKEATNSTTYVLEFEGFTAVIVSVVTVYLLILFCMDSATRLIKLAFLELTAPVSVVAYIYGGNDILKNWFKETFNTYLSFFIRVASLAFLILVLTRLPQIFISFPGEYISLVKIFMIIGTLIFVKKAPDIISKVFGVKLDTQGGIGGRLGQMAGIGKTAQNAWKSMGNKAKTIGTTAKNIGTSAVKGVGALGLGAGKVGLTALDNQRFEGNGRRAINDFMSKSVVQGGIDAAKTIHAAGKGGFKDAVKYAADSKTAKTLKENSAARNKAIDDKFKLDRRKKLGFAADGAFLDKNSNEVVSNVKENIKNSNCTAQQKKIMDAYTDTKHIAGKAAGIKAKYDANNALLQKSYENSTGNDTHIKALSELDKMLNSGASTFDLETKINSTVGNGLTKETANTMIANIKNAELQKKELGELLVSSPYADENSEYYISKVGSMFNGDSLSGSKKDFEVLSSKIEEKESIRVKEVEKIRDSEARSDSMKEYIQEVMDLGDHIKTNSKAEIISKNTGGGFTLRNESNNGEFADNPLYFGSSYIEPTIENKSSTTNSGNSALNLDLDFSTGTNFDSSSNATINFNGTESKNFNLKSDSIINIDPSSANVNPEIKLDGSNSNFNISVDTDSPIIGGASSVNFGTFSVDDTPRTYSSDTSSRYNNESEIKNSQNNATGEDEPTESSDSQDISSFFDNLSKAVDDGTNKIDKTLKEQLEVQKSLKNSTDSMNTNLSSKITQLDSSIKEGIDSTKKVNDSVNNLEDVLIKREKDRNSENE